MKLLNITIIALTLPFLLSVPVMAQHAGPYVGAYIGANALMSAKSTDNMGDFALTFNPALQGSAVLGWDLEPDNPVGEGRIELEYTRQSNPLDQVKFLERNFKGSGNVTMESLLINFFGVFIDKSPWAPYFGIGLGVARIEASNLMVTGQPLATGSDTVFAYQVGTGVDFSLTKHLNIDLGYRLFSSARPTFTEANGQKLQMDYISHSAVLGLRAGF